MVKIRQGSGADRIVHALGFCLLLSALFGTQALAQQYPSSVDPATFHPGYYAYIPDHEPIPNDLLINPDLVGLKIKYRWKDIEVGKGVYDFSQIESDLATLQRYGKRLWIHVTYVEWNAGSTPKTPEYMWTDSSYGGDPRYYGNYERTVQSGGWYPVFWNTNVRRQLIGLYKALGERFRGEEGVEGLVIPETAAQQLGDFDCNGYLQTLKDTALAAKAAIGNKIVMQQINFACFDLATHAQWMSRNNISFGAPDILIEGILPAETYPLFAKYSKVLPVGPDVQWDNYVRNNMSVREIRDYIIDNLNPWYVFWRVRDPYFRDEVLPAIFSRKLPNAEQFYFWRDAQTRPKPPTILE